MMGSDALCMISSSSPPLRLARASSSSDCVVSARALSWPWSSPSEQHHDPHPYQQESRQEKALLASPPSGRAGGRGEAIAIPLKFSRKAQISLNMEQVKNGHGLHRLPVWLPNSPLIPRPRASYNAASLAYLGDSIYELYVRCHFLTPPQSIDKYNSLVMSLVCCEAQDAFLRKLLEDDFLTQEERLVVRWGKNVQTSHKRATKRAGTAVYCSASSLETLIGYLYLTDTGRLGEVMTKLGLNLESGVGMERTK